MNCTAVIRAVTAATLLAFPVLVFVWSCTGRPSNDGPDAASDTSVGTSTGNRTGTNTGTAAGTCTLTGTHTSVYDGPGYNECGVWICGIAGPNCGSTCKDLNKDPSNCGACGNTCGVGRVCSSGECVSGN